MLYSHKLVGDYTWPLPFIFFFWFQIKFAKGRNAEHIALQWTSRIDICYANVLHRLFLIVGDVFLKSYEGVYAIGSSRSSSEKKKWCNKLSFSKPLFLFQGNKIVE